MDALLPDYDPDGGEWFPGPPWLDRLMLGLGLLSLAGLILFAYQGTR